MSGDANPIWVEQLRDLGGEQLGVKDLGKAQLGELGGEQLGDLGGEQLGVKDLGGACSFPLRF